MKISQEVVKMLLFANDLLLTHGLNGIRNTPKNKIQEVDGGRKDYKIDCIHYLNLKIGKLVGNEDITFSLWRI